ncbi:hypothetical protein [Streptomyces sp. VRA16 Mangrove soil]|uniref:hypothetical protein n=1 Tax=Streptomyces sp. VRA16 Mangrove soil TaxID=2817434 RepID=UPI001A9D168F|nr:hypothetical protein [Streptomyces sp. VRA16 Mangrove soil]MBO1331049.1 hypothetical protein [Streptomyces sp. VRA16 Mangrove soil]
MTNPYTPVPPPGPGMRAVPRWARKRVAIPALGVALLLGGAIGAAGGDGSDGGSSKVAAASQARPTATVTTTATATATESAEPEPAPTVTTTETVKVKVTVTAKSATGSGSGSSGSGSGSQADTGTCSIVSNSGNCYSAGQYCRNSDHGASTTTASGAAITCRYSSNAWRWSYS